MNGRNLILPILVAVLSPGIVPCSFSLAEEKPTIITTSATASLNQAFPDRTWL